MLSSLEYSVVDSETGELVPLHSVEDLLIDFEDKKRVVSVRSFVCRDFFSYDYSALRYFITALSLFHSLHQTLAAGGAQITAKISSPTSSVDFSSFRDFENSVSSSEVPPAASQFLQPTALLTCLYTQHYSGRGPLIDHTFVIDMDRCQILSNPIGQEGINWSFSYLQLMHINR